MTDTTRNARRAAQIFNLDEASLSSPIAGKIWRTRSEPADVFTSVAVTHWAMVVTRLEGRTSLTVRGPETRASTVPIPGEAEFVGVEFRLGTFMPHLPAEELVDRGLTLPAAGTRTFWLAGSAWEFPTFENLDVFLGRLAREGIVAREPTVDAALLGRPTDLSLRSVQRRVRRATGLTHVAIKQIERAQRALQLLESGATILDVVERVGYADQPHLNRSLRRFIGHTPAQVLSERGQPRL